MPWNWISWRLLRYIGLALVGLIIVLRLAAFTPLAHGFVEARLEAVSVRGQSVKIENISGDLLGRFSIDRISFSDSVGTWTTVEDVTASWRVLPLLWGRLHLNEAYVETIETRRRPVLQPPRPRASNRGGFLSAYVLDRIAVSNIVLAEGVAGPEQTYQLDASLRMRGARGDVAVNLTPLNGGGDDVELDIAWGDDVPVRGEISITGAPNGLIAKLLQIPQDAGFRAQAEAIGSAKDWTLTAQSQIGDDEWFTASAQQDGSLLTAEGSVSLSSIGAATALRARIGDRADWRIGFERPDGAMTGALETDTLIANVSGNRNSDRPGLWLAPFNADVTEINAPRLFGRDGLDFSAFSADGQLSLLGASSFVFEGGISAPKIGYNDSLAENFVSQGRIELADRELALDTTLAASRVTGVPRQMTLNDQSAALIEVDAQLDFADISASIDFLNAQIGGARLSAMGQISRHGPIDLSGDLSVPDLQGMAALEGDWAIKGASLSAFTSELTGVADLRGAPQDLQEIAGASADLDLSLQRMADRISIERALVTSDRLSMTAQGQLVSGRIALDGQANLAGMTRAGVSADAIETEFAVLGPLAAPVLNMVAKTSRLQVSNQELTDVRLKVEDVVLTELSGQTDLQADLAGAPLRSSIAFQRSGRVVELRSGLATWNAYRVGLSGRFDPASPRLSNLQIDLSGSSAELGQLEGGLNYRDETLNARIELSDVRYSGLTLERAELSATGQWPVFEGSTSYQGDVPWLGIETDFAGDQTFRIDGLQRRLDFEGELAIADQTIAIEAPTHVSFSQTPEILATLKAFEGRVELDVDPSGETLSSLKLRDIAMSEIGKLIDRPALLGALSGDAQVQIDAGALSGKGSFSLAGLARGDLTDAATDLTAAFSIEENRLALAADARDEENTLELGLTFETLLRHRGSLFSVVLEPDAARPTRLTGRGQIAPIWALVAPSDLRLEGAFEADLANGDGTSSRFAGAAKLDDGVFEDGFSGLHLKDMHIDALIEPSGIQLNRAEARGSRGGHVAATGVYGFDDSGDIQVQLSGLDAFNRSDVTASVSGALSIDRRNRLTRVQGDVEIDRAKVDLSRLPRAGYTTLDVTFASEEDGEQAANPPREAINLDLNVTADRGIFVDGAGVDTEWAARLRVKGPAGAPQVTGRSTLVRGEADLLGRRFRFAEGVLRFIGEIDETEIEVRADRTSGGITSSVGVTGTVSDPQIELSSDPQVPDDEILARVLFGRSPSELSPLQAAQLATAAAQLAGGNAFNLVGQLEAATGLDRLDLGFDDDGSATLATGKYLAEDVYLEIESGVTGAPGVALEWTPLENVAVDAEIDPELGPKIALQWTQDFDRLPFDDADEQSE